MTSSPAGFPCPGRDSETGKGAGAPGKEVSERAGERRMLPGRSASGRGGLPGTPTPARDCAFGGSTGSSTFGEENSRLAWGQPLSHFEIFPLAPRKGLLDSSGGFDKLSVVFKCLNIYSVDILISMTVRTSLEFLTGDTPKKQKQIYL